MGTIPENNPPGEGCLRRASRSGEPLTCFHFRRQLRVLHAQAVAAQQQQQQQQAAAGGGAAPAAAPAAAAAAAPAAGAAAAAASGITTRERELGDGDEALRNAKRRKPTSRLLPLSFTTPSTTSSSPSPSDARLAPSLSSLESLAASYKQLQEIERRVDWTVARKKVEVGEAAQGLGIGGAGGAGRGRQLKRTLRVHLTATLKNQPAHLSPAELLAAGEDVPAADAPKAGDDADIAVDGAEVVKTEGQEGEVKEKEDGEEKKKEKEAVKVPSVEIRVTGEVLDDPVHPHPLAHYLSRLVLESLPSPSSAPSAPAPAPAPVSWTRPAPSNPPSSTTAPALPAAFTSLFPTTSSLSHPFRLTLYLLHPAGDRFALVPELAHLVDLAESDRVGVLEALWGYARERGLVVGPEEGGGGAQANGTVAQGPGPKGGIRTDARLAKFFGNQALVPFHLLPEYINRCLAPAQPRVIDVNIDLSSSASTEQHFAFDLDLYVPSPLTTTLSAVNRSLSSLTSSSSSSDPSSASTSDARELSALDDKLALNCLSTAQHLQQLHLLLSFTRDPAAFLAEFVDAQAGSLAEILGSSAAATGKEGGKWREELRRSSALEGNGNWADEAARVLALRSTEGKAAALRGAAAQQAQHHALQQQQQAQVAQMHQQQMMAAAAQAQAQMQQQQQQQAMLAAQQQAGAFGRR
ncbi:hypothetical protein JCM6882_005941 [Rhodosporidiobolus microsporus]